MPGRRMLRCMVALAVSWMALVPCVGRGAEQAGANAYITEKQVVERNMLRNGGFEEVNPDTGVPRNWNVGEQWRPGSATACFTVDHASVASGKNALRVTGVGRIQYASSDRASVTGGRAYTLVYSTRQAGIGEGMLGGSIEIAWYKTGGQKTMSRVDFLKGPLAWRRRTVHLVAPEEAQTVAVYLEKHSREGVLWFDDLALAEGIMQKAAGDISPSEWVRQYAVYENMQLDLGRFTQFRSRHMSSSSRPRLEALLARINAMKRKYAAHLERHGLDEEALPSELGRAYGSGTRDAEGEYAPLVDLWYGDYLEIAAEMKACKGEIDDHIRKNAPGQIESQIRKVFGQHAEYGLGVTNGMQKVLKQEPYLGPIADRAQVSLAGNEHEGLQVVVLALQKELRGVRVTISDLVAGDGNVLSAERVKVFPVGYVQTNPPEYPIDYVGLWPDPLLKDAARDFGPRANQPFWIDVNAPAGTPSGLYHGQIRVAVANSHELILPLTAKVWGFEIPRTGRFKVFGRFRPDKLLKFYRWPELPEDIELAWYLFLLEHRYTPNDWFTRAMTPTPERGMLKKCLDAGLTVVNVMDVSRWLPRGEADMSWQPPTQADLAAIRSALQSRAALLKEHSALHAGFVFGFDEVSDPSVYPTIAETFRFVHSVVPEFKTITTSVTPPIDAMVSDVDVWMPLLGRPRNDSEVERKKSPGAEVFYYIFGEPQHPFPNASLIDYPALDGRITFWMMFARNRTGWGHWYVNGWEANFAGQGRWPDVPWKPYSSPRYAGRNGEGYFIYPGPDGLPLSSIRFENLRDGIEDWEMMYMLRQHAESMPEGDVRRAAAERLLRDVRELVPTQYRYCNDPDRLLRLRERIAAQLEILSRGSGRPRAEGG